jgi:iron complex outermembrane receptor protein
MIRGGVRHETIELDVGEGINANSQPVTGATLDFDETLYSLSGVVFLSDNVELFTGYSEGFSLADFGRAVRDSTATDAAELKSEAQTVDNYELGLRGRGPNWNGSISGFYSTSEEGSSFNQNLELVKRPEKITGVEMEGEVNTSETSRVGGTVTWMEGVVDLDDQGGYDEDLPSTRIPPLKVTAFAELQVQPGWQLRVEQLHSGFREPDSTQYGGNKVEPYTIYNLHNAIDLPKGELQIGVENLFNEFYFPVISQAAGTTYSHSAGQGTTVAMSYSLDW